MALYNEIRPHTFDSIVGQRSIVKNIRSQSIQNKFFGTYIFAGQYGTGKTTMNRILAMAINCEHKDENGNPCCECASCKSIIEKTAVDFVEVDGASNTGVDKVRELIADANFKPVYLKKKVICIDEVHMLSTSAFNALLKTLEEPPEDTTFILCTTEIRKIPDTVVSRAASYIFGRIDVSDISDYLKKVCNDKGYTCDEDGISLIARRSDGSMRNALSILEQTAAGGDINVCNVRELLNLADGEQMIQLIKAVLTNEQECLIKLANEITANGDMLSIVSDLADIVRDVILSKMDALDDASEYGKAIHTIDASAERLVLLSDVLCKVRDMVRQGYGKQTLLLELIKFSVSVVSVEDRISSLEEQIKNLKSGVVVAAPIPEEVITLGNSSDEEVESTAADDESDSDGFETLKDSSCDDKDDNPFVEQKEPEKEPEKQVEPVPSEPEPVEENFIDFSFGFMGFDMLGDTVSEKPLERNNEPVLKTASAIAPEIPSDDIVDSTHVESNVDYECKLLEAAAKDSVFKEALVCGSQRSVGIDGKVLVETPFEPVKKILDTCIDVYGIENVSVSLNKDIVC